MGWFDRWRPQREGPWVRPWAIAAPVLVLLMAAPLLRPLWAPGTASEREVVTLEAVRSILNDGTLALDPARVRGAESVVRVSGQLFPADAPAFPVILSSVGWAIERVGVPVDKNPVLFEYLLTFFAVTLPSALACGLVYRMGRAFELRRWWRMLLALACMLATGWFSYAVVLLPHALAAALVTAAAASAVHVMSARRPMRAVGWLAGGGLAAGLAAVIEPAALWALLLLPILVLAITHPTRVRIAGMLLVIAGAAPPLALHATINQPVTGDLLPARWHQSIAHPAPAPLAPPALADDDDPLAPSVWLSIGRAFNRLITFTVGAHGIFSHFPVLLLGLAGAGMVLHRHWTRVLKVLASGVLLAITLLLIVRMSQRLDLVDLSFAAPRLLTALPLLLLFAGAWLRRAHGAVVYALAGVALALSVAITMIGATAPAPADGYTTYTAARAAERLFFPGTPIEAARAD